jgi:hypothetical protein
LIRFVPQSDSGVVLKIFLQEGGRGDKSTSSKRELTNIFQKIPRIASKIGFSVPIVEWFSSELRYYLEILFSKDYLKQQDLLKSGKVIKNKRKNTKSYKCHIVNI